MKMKSIRNIALVVSFMSATALLATTPEEIVSKMQSHGYTDISTSKTFWGKTNVTGYIQGRKHEVIIDGNGNVIRSSLADEASGRDTKSSSSNQADADEPKAGFDDRLTEEEEREINRGGGGNNSGSSSNRNDDRDDEPRAGFDDRLTDDEEREINQGSSGSNAPEREEDFIDVMPSIPVN